MGDAAVPVDGLKRLQILKRRLQEHARECLGDLAEEIYAKGYDFENYPALFKISFEGCDTVATIDYHRKEIYFDRSFSDDAAKLVTGLKDTLFYKPILDAVKEKILSLPYFYDAPGDVLDELSEKMTLPKRMIEDRTIVGKVELNAGDIETVTTILEQNDFPGLFEDYSADVLSSYVTGAAPTMAC